MGTHTVQNCMCFQIEKHLIFFIKNIHIGIHLPALSSILTLSITSNFSIVTARASRPLITWTRGCFIISFVTVPIREVTWNGYDCAASLIAMFMGPTWNPSGADRTQVGPMRAPRTLLSGMANQCFGGTCWRIFINLLQPRDFGQCWFHKMV